MSIDSTNLNMDNLTFRLTLLNNTNYPQWKGEMRAVLQKKKLWSLVAGTRKKPTDEDKKQAWDDDAAMAAGDIFLGVQVEQRVHLNNIAEDLVKMWLKLKAVHLQKHPGTRFNAYDNLFVIRMKLEETLSSLMNRVDQAIIGIQNLRPEAFTLAKMDQELACMAMICTLPEDYSSFVSATLLLTDLDKEKLQSAFITEEAQRHHKENSPTTALRASTQTGPKICTFCKYKGHMQDTCTRYLGARKEMQCQLAESRLSKQNNSIPTVQQVPHNAQQSTYAGTAKFAGNASVGELIKVRTSLVYFKYLSPEKNYQKGLLTIKKII